MKTSKLQKAGPALVLISAVMFSFGGLFTKSIPWNPLSINAARNFLAIFITLAFIKVTKRKLVFNKTVLLSGLAMAYTTTFFCIANKLTTAANTILLQFTSPVFVILFSFIFWKQRPAKRDLAMCACVFLGVLCFFFESISAGNIWGDLLALSTGLTYAVVFMCNRMKGGDAVSTFFVGEIISTVIGMPFLLRETQFTGAPILSALAFGVCLGGGYVLMSQGLRFVRPVQANLMSALEPVLNPVWVALFYGESVSKPAIAGFVIVLVSIVAFNIKKAEKAKDSVPG